MKYKQIDLTRLEDDIRSMKRYHKLYKMLKRVLSEIGHWRNLKRGNPSVDNLRK